MTSWVLATYGAATLFELMLALSQAGFRLDAWRPYLDRARRALEKLTAPRLGKSAKGQRDDGGRGGPLYTNAEEPSVGYGARLRSADSR